MERDIRVSPKRPVRTSLFRSQLFTNPRPTRGVGGEVGKLLSFHSLVGPTSTLLLP